MPLCAAFHEIAQKQNTYAILQFSGSEQVFTSIAGSRHAVPEEKLTLVEAMKDRVLIDLTPEIDECYALGPYSVEGAQNLETAPYGRIVNYAKYWHIREAMEELVLELAGFISKHPKLRRVFHVAAAPRRNEHDVRPGEVLARGVADALGIKLVQPRKTRATRPQKERGDEESEVELINRVRGSMVVETALGGEGVVIIDDVLGSGGTIREIGRALREAGANWVGATCVAKRARDLRGGVDLRAELWR